MSHTPAGPRTGFRAATAALVCLVGVVIAVGQPPGSRTAEEEEANPPKVPRKIEVEDEGPPPVTVPKGAYYVRLEDVARAARDAKHPGIRDTLAKFVVAFDVYTDAADRKIRVLPIPIHRTETFPPRFGVFTLTDDNAPRTLRGVDFLGVRKLEHFEELGTAAADMLARKPGEGKSTPFDDADPAERLAAAERLYVAVLSFHDGARDVNRRRGKGWEAVRTALADKLAAARRKRLALAVERKDWDTVRRLGGRMADLYASNVKLLQEVFAARLAEAESVVAASVSPTELERARGILTEYEGKFPGSNDPAPARLRDALKKKAAKLFESAERAVKANAPDARTLIRTVELLDPDFPGLRELQGQLKSGYAVMYVGVGQLPERVSPFASRYDSEKMAEDLVFEGLLEATPDETHGVRYRPALAANMPTPGALVRDFPLARPAEWAAAGAGLFDAADVANTLKLLRANRHTWAADGIDFLDDQTRVDDPGRVRIGLASGHPFPLSLLTFKVLPVRWNTARNAPTDDVAFGLKPVGTGPYKLHSVPGEKGPREVAFVANPAFGRRPGRLGQPFINEIRFVETAKLGNPVAEFKADKLHVLTDVPTQDLAKYTSAASGLTGRVQVVTAVANRRVQLLAVNHRRPNLQSPALRRGIAHAIDRETILTEVYRASYSEFHKPLAGPFPTDTWAAPRPLGAAPKPLFDRDQSQAKFAEYAAKFGAVVLTLTFPGDDPRAAAACGKIVKMIETVGEGGAGKVTVKLDPLPTPEFYRKVYEDNGFDLAYVSFEFRDDLYPFGLGALLDPTADARGGRNFMAALVKANNPSADDETLGRLLAEARAHADPGKLVPLSHEIYRRFNEAMPFIPLWKLDRHTVLTTALKPTFDPTGDAVLSKWLPATRMFAGVGRWRME